MLHKLLIVVFAGLLLGCTPYPYKSYYELDEAIANAETEEEKTYYKEKLDQFEKTAIESDKYYEMRQACHSGNTQSVFGDRGVWVCRNVHERDVERRPFKDIVEQVREYRRVRGSCGCYDRRSVFDGLGRH